MDEGLGFFFILPQLLSFARLILKGDGLFLVDTNTTHLLWLSGLEL